MSRSELDNAIGADLLADAARRLATDAGLGEQALTAAQLLVPRLAEWCIVDVIDTQRRSSHVQRWHTDGDEGRNLLQWHQLLGAKGEHGPSRVLRSRQAEMVNHEGVPAHVLAVPMFTGARTIGILVLGRRLDGTPFSVADTATITGLAGVAASAFDASLRLAEETLLRKNAEANEERYRALADAVPQIVFAARPDGFLDYYNRRWFDYTGMTPEEALLFGWQPVIHPDCRAELDLRWSSCLSTGQFLEIECRLLRESDAAYRWHLVRAAPIFDDEGIVRWVGTCTDINDQKRSEQATQLLAEASTILSSSFDYDVTLQTVARLAVPTLADWCAIDILEGDKLRRLAFAHTDSQKTDLGYELERRYPTRLDSSQGVAPVLRQLQSELLVDVPDQVLGQRVQGLEHAQLWRELGVSSLLVVPIVVLGRAVGCISMGMASSLRSFGDSDLALVEELARRAGLAMDNANLYREAKEADRLKDEFLATVSHELRTPLNAILGWTRLLRSGGLDESTVARALETVERNALLQTKIIADILDISRIITGKLRLNVQPLELSKVIATAVDTVRPAADAKGIVIETVCDPRADHISGDPDRLQQVVWNLLSNAIKFTPPGGRVGISLERADNGARLSVRDNGKGIKPEFLPFVFDRFRQGDSASTRMHGGLGLGLSIVKNLVELHGGTVHAESDGLQCGASFAVTMPLRAVRADLELADEDTAARVHQHNAKPLVARLDGIRVMVVDDDADARELLRTVLRRYGADVVVAASAPDALDLLRRREVDVVLSDIAMPGQDGYELMRQVRALSKELGGLTPAAALTAYAREEDKRRALAAGYQEHVAKPVEPAELIATVQKLARLRTLVSRSHPPALV